MLEDQAFHYQLGHLLLSAPAPAPGLPFAPDEPDSRYGASLRLEFLGVLYHITSRGDGREAIYRGDVDRRSFLELLADSSYRATT